MTSPSPRNAAGFSLLEALVAIFLTSIALLAAAPMFVHASHATDVSADMGSVGADDFCACFFVIDGGADDD